MLGKYVQFKDKAIGGSGGSHLCSVIQLSLKDAFPTRFFLWPVKSILSAGPCEISTQIHNRLI